MSETKSIREEALVYCVGNGVDLGYGGDKITKSAISIDLYTPQLNFDSDDTNYKGDARELPFKNNVLDYVYSSHLLEDFENTVDILIEWIRVLKIGGHLILYLPIQRVYLEVCRKYNVIPNAGHRTDMSYEYILNCINNLPLEIIKYIPIHASYSFFIVMRKV